jgi:ATP-binding protein involved in chromosome partitioning
MASGALGQLVDAHWGDTQVLVIDLPPVQAMCSSPWCKSTSRRAVIVSTPQDLALMDATRALKLFDAAKVPVIGLVENMAGYVCPHCGNVSDPFGSGGVEQAAADLGLPFLGVFRSICRSAGIDAGQPPAAGEGPQAEAFLRIARVVKGWLRRAPDHGHHARQVLIGGAACGGCWRVAAAAARISAAHRAGAGRGGV